MTRGLNLRAILADNYTVLLVALALLALVGASFTATTVLAPGTQEVERSVASWDTTGRFAHQAEVVGDSEVFAGTLRNRTVYFTTVTPVLSGVQTFTYGDATNGSVSVEATARLTLRSTTESGDQELEYWRTTRPLNRTTASDVGPGERVPIHFALNFSAIRNQTEEIETELGASGRTEALVNVTVQYSGTVEGEAVSGEQAYSMPILVRGTTYLVLDDATVVTQHDRTEIRTIPVTYGPLRTIGVPLGTLLVLLLLGGLVYLGGGPSPFEDQLTLTPAERRYLSYRQDRAEFADWISTIRLPPAAHEKPIAEADALADLVDFAIDTDNAVLEDPAEDTFYVVHDDYLYRYEAPTKPTSSSLLSDPSNVLWERSPTPADDTESSAAPAESDHSRRDAMAGDRDTAGRTPGDSERQDTD